MNRIFFHFIDFQNIQTFKVGHNYDVDNTENLFNFGIYYTSSDGSDWLHVAIHGIGLITLGDFSCCPSGSVQVKVDKRMEGSSCVYTVRSSLSGGNADLWTSSPQGCGAYNHETTQVWMKGNQNWNNANGQIENFYFKWL